MALVLAALGGLVWWIVASVTAPALGGEALRDCGLVVDQSAIAASPELTQQWGPTAHEYAASCSAGEARMAIATIDPSGASATIVTFDLHPEKSRSGAMRERSREDRLAAVTAHLDDVLEPATNAETVGADVFGAMDDVGDGLDPSTPTHLLVLTTGLQHSDSATVAPLEDPAVDPASAADEVALLPDLEGVDVTVVGVGTSPSPDDPPPPDWYQRSLETWWTATITRAGGTPCHVGPVPPHTTDPKACA